MKLRELMREYMHSECSDAIFVRFRFRLSARDHRPHRSSLIEMNCWPAFREQLNRKGIIRSVETNINYQCAPLGLACVAIDTEQFLAKNKVDDDDCTH